MNKGSILILILLSGFTAALAQTTRIEISHPDGQAPGNVTVYAASRLLGETNSAGLLTVNELLGPSVLKLMQNGRRQEFEVLDSSYQTEQSGPPGRIGGYRLLKLQILPLSIEAVLVSASRAGEKTPVASSTVSRADLQVQNTGRDLPVMLQYQPGVTITSDAGAGVGYTGIRVRGSDASRTNVTVNGVPINDAESHGTFWVNMPDLAGSLSSVQVQRGAGTSTNGAGAFGATVNMQTYSSNKPYALLSSSYGSFNTRRNSISAGTGLINGHWTVDMRLSDIRSDGFVDRAFSNMQSWYLSAGYSARKWNLKMLAFGGKEHTYQSWWGVPKEKYDGDQNALRAHYLRNQGFTYRNAEDSANLFGSDNRSYNYYTYNNETDNYRQNHYHLYFNRRTGKHAMLSATLYYTRGAGYYEQFRPDDNIYRYTSRLVVIGSDTIRSSDVIRQRWLDNHLLGTNITWHYEKDRWDIIAGAAYNEYSGDHFGRVIWARIIPSLNHESHYYDATGFKNDGNVFVKGTHRFGHDWYAWADLQVRRVHHEGLGFDNDLRRINFSRDFTFFNPKAGVMKKMKDQQFFASVSVANREPSRSDFTDNPAAGVPRPERLTDFEAGWNRNLGRGQVFVNLYYMHYKDQLVLTGAVNDVGTPLRRNAESSYRAGIEAGTEYSFGKKLKVGGNIAISRNRILHAGLTIPDYSGLPNKDSVFHDAPIAMSPDVNGSAWIMYELPGKIQARWMHRYVGRQYLDNTGDQYRSLDPYYFSELWLNREFALKGGAVLELQFQVLNLFNARYASNGYTYMYTYGSPDITQEVFVYPQAGRHIMGGMVVKF